MSDDDWGYDPTPRERLDAESASETDIAALRREVAALRDLLENERIDSGEEAVIADNRRALAARAERDARAAVAANDPATVAALRDLETEEEVLAFLRENGMGG